MIKTVRKNVKHLHGAEGIRTCGGLVDFKRTAGGFNGKGLARGFQTHGGWFRAAPKDF